VRRDETVHQMGVRLAKQACDDERVQIVVANEPGAVSPTAKRGCAPLVLAGATTNDDFRVEHAGSAPTVTCLGGSAGGALANTLSVEALQAPAYEAILELDRATNRRVRYQQITLQPDGAVDISLPVPFSATPLHP
jgi:hypothetical protein